MWDLACSDGVVGGGEGTLPWEGNTHHHQASCYQGAVCVVCTLGGGDGVVFEHVTTTQLVISFLAVH